MTPAGRQLTDEELLLTTEQRRDLSLASPTSSRIVTVLAAVNDASRRRWRWPAAIIDRACARRHVEPGRDEETAPSQTKKLSLDSSAAIRERMITSFAGGDIGGLQKNFSCERPRRAELFSPAQRRELGWRRTHPPSC
jgi:hypothetical protein